MQKTLSSMPHIRDHGKDLGVDLDFVEAASEKEGAAHDEEQVAQDGPRLGGLTR